MSDSLDQENPIRAEKRRKLHALREKSYDPYPHTFERTGRIEEIRGSYSDIATGEVLKDKVYKLAGRVMTKRPMGKAAFFNIQDQSGNLQCYLKTSELSETDQLAFDHIDLGDIVGIEGFVFKTQKGELSLHCQKFQILCKTLEPLPEKFHGIQDIEIKYRHRHLDLISDRKP